MSSVDVEASAGPGSADPGRHALAYVGELDHHIWRVLAALGEAGYVVDLVDDVAAWCRECFAESRVVLIGAGDAPLKGVARTAALVPAECSVVVLIDPDDGFDFLAAVQAGVSGFCAPDAPVEAIVRTIDDVVAYGAALPRSHVGALVAQLRRCRGRVFSVAGSEVEVTMREWDVLSRLCSGMSSADISVELFVSAATVRSHVKSLVGKFGVNDRDDLIELFRAAVGPS